MEKRLNFVPRIAIFLAGVAAGMLTLPRRERGQTARNADYGKSDEGMLTLPRRERTQTGPGASQEFKDAVSQLENRLENRLAAHESATAARLAQMEARIDDHTSRLADVPTTAQIVAAMDQLLSKTMASLDERLTSQAHSIEVLKTTVSQTDSLLERVLESLDSLQSYTETPELEDDSLLRPA